VKHQKSVVIALGIASLACAPAGRQGEVIHIGEESAIIVWDAQARTQHFIRRASFQTEAKDFGFIVPTPGVPKLAEADDVAFRHLERVITPPNREATKSAKGPPPKAAAAKVEVIAQEKVAGYDASVLSANDPAALDAWLKKNGYASSPELTEWYKDYIDKKWIFTAFKISKDEPGRAHGRAVRMTFATDTPFFPYREPRAEVKKDEYRPDRVLKMYFIGDAKVDASISGGAAWPGRTIWSKPLTEGDSDRLVKLLKLPGLGAGERRLTVFEDRSEIRPGNGDLFFAKAADQSLVLHPVETMMQQIAPGTAPKQSYVDRTSWDFTDRWDPWDIPGQVLGLLFIALALRLLAALFGIRKP
jgi:hypothetical protein